MVLCPPPPEKKGTVISSVARKRHLTNMDFQIFLGEDPQTPSPWGFALLPLAVFSWGYSPLSMNPGSDPAGGRWQRRVTLFDERLYLSARVEGLSGFIVFFFFFFFLQYIMIF